MSGTNDTDQRVAAADLVRLAEPGDILLAALVRARGHTDALALAVSEQPGDRRAATRAILEELGVEDTGEQTAAHGARVRDAFDRWRVRLDSLDGQRDLRVMERMQARLLLPGDDEWPDHMDDLGIHAPVALWVRGPAQLSAALQRSAAIVGSRAAEPYGLAVTRTLAWDLVAAGLTVVSGGAYGVDAAAHQTALDAGGTTIAFLACGVDVHYPRGNDSLLAQIAHEGALVSECAPGQSAMRHRFLLRNRLIAAAARTTVVTAAGHRSGALHTANRAAELLRPVGAVPGSVLSDHAAGCHRLVHEGAAVLVTDAQDVLALAGPLTDLPEEDGETQASLRITDAMTPEQLQLYGALPVRRGLDVPTLAARAGLSIPAALSALGMLELAGHARRAAQGWTKDSPGD